MNHPPHKGNAPLIVSEGTVVGKRDMLRALETLESVAYQDEVDQTIVSEGEAYVVKVFAGKDSSTLVINGSVFLNVLSFDHLHFYTGDDGECVMELVQGTRILRLIPRAEVVRMPGREDTGYVTEDDSFEGEDAVTHQLLDDYADYEDDD